ncbi:pirin [Desulfovibrio sp. OttesenSCG-928-I05]|nr:pirin [Desulfovibrio sp. OttesenSCG-928-I05]
MPSKKPRITVYLTPEEHAEISASAARAGISLSQFAKLVCTGMAVPSLEHKQAVHEIIKARADLGRLGGLFKQGIAAGGDKFALNRLLKEVDIGMQELKAAAMRIR